MQVILLSHHVKITDPRHQRIIRYQPHAVLHAVIARMRHPLCARHELPQHIGAKGIAHPTMTPRKAHTGCDRGGHVFGLILRDAAHRPDGHDQRKIGQLGGIVKTAKRVRHRDFKSRRRKIGSKLCGHFFRVMPQPTAPCDQCLLCHARPLLCIIFQGRGAKVNLEPLWRGRFVGHDGFNFRHHVGRQFGLVVQCGQIISQLAGARRAKDHR